MPTYRDRIKDFRRVRAADIAPNPANWRLHPQSQKNAMRSVLEEVGIADALICRELADGTLQLLDGHLRESLDPDLVWPVLVLDVDDEEADKLLATFDPITGLAELDPAKLHELVEKIDFDSAELRRMMDDMLSDFSPEELVEELKEAGATEDDMVDLDKMELQPDEHYDFILVLADNVNDWNRLVALLELPEVCLSRTHRRIGIGRAVRAEKVLGLIDGKKEKKD